MRVNIAQPPILILAFNRADTLAELYRALTPIAPSRIYVACDGPRDRVPGEATRVDEVRRLLANPPWKCSVETRFLETNQGCGPAVSGALDWFFAQEECGVVLEDDCIPSASFLPFCAEMLARYRDEPRVMSVLGTRHAVARPTQVSSYSFSRLFAPWGWASWRRAWERYRFHLGDWRADCTPYGVPSKALTAAGNRGWSSKLDGVAPKSGPPHAWAYQFNFAHFRHEGLAVLPRVNLVSNIGFGDGSTHTSRVSAWANLPRGELAFPLQHPTDVEPDVVADRHRETWHLNHRWWLARKIWQMRNRHGLATRNAQRGW